MEKEASQKDYILYYDLLNVSACLAVIYLHCNGIVHSFSATSAWGQALAVEVMAYWAVPVFFMLTGAKTLNYRLRYTTKEFLESRFKRLFVPFIFWSLFLFYFRNESLLTNPETHTGLGLFIKALMGNTIEPTYWFFWSMFSISFAIPAISLLINNQRLINYLIGTFFIFHSIFPTLFRLLGIPWNDGLVNPVVSSYLGYVLIGFQLSTRDDLFETRKSRISLYVVALLCLAFRYVYTYITSMCSGEVNRVLFDYNSMVAVIPSVAVFIIFRQLFSGTRLSAHLTKPLPLKVIKSLSKCCFGVYLIHKLILDNLIAGALGIPMESCFMRQVCPLLIFIICVILVTLIKHIPLIKSTMP